MWSQTNRSQRVANPLQLSIDIRTVVYFAQTKKGKAEKHALVFRRTSTRSNARQRSGYGWIRWIENTSDTTIRPLARLVLPLLIFCSLHPRFVRLRVLSR